MTRNVNVTVSGGRAVIGNVVQGDANQVSSEQDLNGEFQHAAQEAEELAARSGASEAQLQALLSELELLKQRIDAKDSAPALTETIKKTLSSFAWAAPALKTLVQKLLPKIAAVLF